MYGLNINTLNVYMKSSGQLGQGIKIWTMQGTQGNQWKHATINVSPTSNYQVPSVLEFQLFFV
jgi:hypothetical protein